MTSVWCNNMEDSEQLQNNNRSFPEKYFTVPYPIKMSFRLLRVCGGLTLDFEPSPDGRIIFRKSCCMLMKSCMVSLAIVVLPIGLCGWMLHSQGFHVDALRHHFTINGGTQTDLLVLILLQVCLFVSVFCLPLSQSMMGQPFNQFTENIMNLEPLDREVKEGIAKLAVKRALGLLAWFLTPAICNGCVMINFLSDQYPDWNFGSRIVMSLLYGWYNFFLYFPLTALANALLLTHGLNLCNEVLVNYRKSVARAFRSKEADSYSNNAQEQPPLDLESLLGQGECLLGLMNGMENAQGKLAFDECACSLLFAIFGSYMTLALGFYINKASIKFAVVFFGANLSTTLAYTYRMYYVVYHGQIIEDNVAELVKVIRAKCSENVDVISPKQIARMTALKDTLIEFGGIEPRKMFKLNRSMMLSVLSVVVTYLIVLLQFKAGDS